MRRTQNKAADASTLGMNYLLTSEIVPAALGFAAYTNFHGASGPFAPTIVSNAWRRAATLETNLYELRLTFQWPVYDFGPTSQMRVGPNRKVYRTLVSGNLNRTNAFGLSYYFFDPGSYMQSTNQ